MRLEGSCHCRAVRFAVESRHPYPFNLCYCSICRKTAGSGGFAINLAAAADTLEVEGREHVRTYHARLGDDETADDTAGDTAGDAAGDAARSPAERAFCGECGSALWLWDPSWPELLHPHASAIDTPLPAPPERVHLMLASRAPWAEPCLGAGDRTFDAYPDESIADWHRRLKLER